MSIFSKLTKRTLAKNKMRTAVTIIGIILSAAMFTAVTTTISTFQDCMCRNSIYYKGYWHIMADSIDAKQLQDIQNDDDVVNTWVSQNIGFAKIDSQNEYKPYVSIIGTNELFNENMPVYLTSGELPKNSTEIIIPSHLENNGGVKYEIGDTVTYDLGYRVDENGEAMSNPNNAEYIVGEELQIVATRTYTVVGVYSRADFENYSAPGYVCLTTFDNTIPSSSFNAYMLLNNPKDAYNKSSEMYVSGIKQMSDNSDYLMCMGISGYRGFMSVLYSFAAILIVLIMFGSISLIYNAFAISVSERTKQFGLLSSVGATHKQIRSMVFTEALMLSGIGIPIGILCGLLGIGVTISALGTKFTSLLSNSHVVPSLSVSPMSIVVAAAIAFVTVIISTLIPSKRATKVTAIEAIRQTQDIKIASAKQMKTSKLTYKLFGIEGAIASKHFKRNKKNNRAAILSLFMSIVLFISASSFCTYLTNAVSRVFTDADCDILVYLDNADSDAAPLYENIKDIDGIKQISYVHVDYAVTSASSDIYSKKFIKLLGKDMQETTDLNVILLAVPDELYASYLDENGYDTEKYMDAQNPIGLGYAKYIGFSMSLQKVVDYDILTVKQGNFTTDDGKTLSFDLSADNVVNGANTDGFYGIKIMYPVSIAEKLGFNLDTATFSISAKDPNAVCDEIYAVLSDTEYECGVSNLYDQSITDRNLVTIINVFSYGFIVLISLIALANVFNTMATNIQLRKREFAMLKTIGMTKRGIQKMLNYECLLYGTRALLFGLPTSAAMTFLIFLSLNSGFEGAFYMPIIPMLIAIGSVFVVVFLSMLYSMRKINKDNVIEAVKNENL